MKIGLYAHSIGFTRTTESFNWVNRLANHFCAKIENYSISNCSEERILFNLKKTKDLDLAIIFHAKPRYMYVPGWNRDLDSLDKNTVQMKAGLDLKKVLQAEYEISDEELNKIPHEDLALMLERFSSIPDKPLFTVLSSINKEQAKQINLNDDQIHNLLQKFVTDHGDKVSFYSDLVHCLLLNRKLMFHPDLQNNRHSGALILTDQYLQAKQIPVVHCIQLKHSVPEWFNFQSGVVDYEIANFQNKYRESSSVSSNYINIEGNQLLFEKILTLIQAARSRVVLR